MTKSEDKALTSSGDNNKRSRSKNREPIDNEKKLPKKRARRKAGDSSSSTSSSSSSSTSAASTSSSSSLVVSAVSYATEPAAVSIINSSSLSSSSAGTVMSAPPTTTAPASPAIPLVIPDEFSYDLTQHAPLTGRCYTDFIRSKSNVNRYPKSPLITLRHQFLGAEDPFLGFNEPIDAPNVELLGVAPPQQDENQHPFPQIPEGELLMPTASSTPQPILIQVDSSDFCCCNKPWQVLIQTDDLYKINDL